MSVLPAEVQGALTQLLQALQSPDNTLRSQAEEQLNNDWTPNRPEVLLMGLAEQLQVAENPSVGRETLKCEGMLRESNRPDPSLQFCSANKPRDNEKSLPVTTRKSSFGPLAVKPKVPFGQSYSKAWRENRSVP